MRVTCGEARYRLSLPAARATRSSNGSWDATGLLLENLDQVREVAGRLPYVSGSLVQVDLYGRASGALAVRRLHDVQERFRRPTSLAGLLKASRTWRVPPSAGTLTATRWPRAISVSAQRRGSSATPIPISTARLMPSRLGSEIWMLIDVRRRS